jgi:hypothetical protein
MNGESGLDEEMGSFTHKVALSRGGDLGRKDSFPVCSMVANVFSLCNL